MEEMKRISVDDLRHRIVARQSESISAPEVGSTSDGTPKTAVPKPPPLPPQAETYSTTRESTEPEPTVEITIAKKGEEIKTEAPIGKEIAKHDNRDFHLDNAEPLSPESFPNPPSEGSRSVPATIPNIQFFLKKYGIKARYNVIKKSPELVIPGLVSTVDNADNVAMAQIKSLARLNGISVSNIEEAILAIADRNQYNSVANWIMSKLWDGKDRLQALYDTLTEREDFPTQFKEILVYRWLISGVAAIFKPQGFKSRGVLTFQGKQGIGKTSWFASLVPDISLRESVVKLDQRMDAGDKDSMIAAATHWLVELGELEGSFKRNIDRLKGFLTNDVDKIRVPYARVASVFPRRTVFGASVNDDRFLVDPTGNSRWWTIPVISINYNHDIDMQQLWAQCATLFESGEQWWLTPEEDISLELLNRDHCVVNVVEERVMPILDLSCKDEPGLPAMTATELLIRIGYRTVTNPQAKECGALLREHLGEPKKIQGYMKWRIPFAKQSDIVKIESY